MAEKIEPPKDLNQQLNDQKYIPKNDMPEISEKVKKEMEKQKKELDKIKNWIIKKYPFTIAISLLPPQSIPKIEAEEPIPEAEKKDKRTHLVVMVPEEEFKNINKIKAEIIQHTTGFKPKIWLHLITPVDVWNFASDGRYDLTSAISLSYPLYDKGILGALRVSEIHKNLCLRKFEKYISSYVIAGSLVRGTATATSDVDVFIIIDDTDIKKMPRLELKERLRGIIYKYIADASAMAGVKNKLEPQVYLLTDFWEAVKDAHPVMFTFIRDGVPLYDKGTFTPWKLLLKMGKIKPSPESIDMFIGMGDKTEKTIKRRFMDAMIDNFWGITTPAQAMLMLYGIPPPTPKETTKLFKDIFYTKEKLIEKKYVEILEKSVQLFKDYEHGKLKEITGAEIDKLVKDGYEFTKRLKKLREEIEKVSQKNTIDEIEKEIFTLLEHLFNKKSKKELIELFDKELVKKGKMPPKSLEIIKTIEKVSQDFKKNKVKAKDIEEARKNSTIIINHLIDYGQRCDLVAVDKARMQIIAGKNRAELILTNYGNFIVQGSTIKKITSKLEASSIQELNKAIAAQKGEVQTKISPKVFEVLKKALGEFEILL